MALKIAKLSPIPPICFACQEIPPKEVVDELRRHAPRGVYFFIASAVDIRKALEDHAPIGKQAAPQGAPQPPPGSPARKQAATADQSDENAAWKDLFDAANDSILTEIKVREE